MTGILSSERYRASKVYMIGPSLQTKGGISTVLHYYRKHYKERFNMRFIASYSGDSRLLDIAFFAVALLRTCLICIFGKDPVFHIHVSTGGSFIRKSIVAEICGLFGKNVIFHMHGADFDDFVANSRGLLNRLIKRELARVGRMVVLSQKWKEFFICHVDESKIHVIYNPVPVINDMHSDRIGAPVRFLFTGRIGQRKGCHDIISAVELLKSEGFSEFRISMFGDGETVRYKELVHKKRLNGIIDVNGWVPYENMLGMYKDYDVLLLPSYCEGLPMSLLEALGYGMPVVTTDVGGISEAVTDGENGYIIKPGDIDALASAIRELTDKREIRERMGRRSLEIALSRFSAEKIECGLKVLYESLGLK